MTQKTSHGMLLQKDGMVELNKSHSDMNRKNINRGFKKLTVWQDAVSLYVIAWQVVSKKTKGR
jgi:hypothetical protein